MNLTEKLKRSEIAFKGTLLTLRVDEVELPNGKAARREWIEHPGAVCILALDPDGKLLMVRQYRYPTGRELLELPAGKLDAGEAPEDCAKRELEEETGYRAEKLISLGSIYPTPAYCSEVIYLYMAKRLSKTHQHLDADEFLTVERLDFDEAVNLCLNGEITDAKTIAAVLKYRLLQAAGQQGDA